MHIKISVITVSFNQGAFIEENILSVLSQNYSSFEHIVIDGGSTDNTLEVLGKYPHLNWISEPDEGQSDALNKGFRKATGDIIAWINSDDMLAPGSMQKVANFFSRNPVALAMVGDLGVISRDGRLLRTLKAYPYDHEMILRKMRGVIQPSTFFCRSVFEKIGYVDENLHYCMDYEFFLRMSRLGPVEYLPETLAFFRRYEESKTGRGPYSFCLEKLAVIKAYGLPWWQSQAARTAVYIILTQPLRAFLRRTGLKPDRSFQ